MENKLSSDQKSRTTRFNGYLMVQWVFNNELSKPETANSNLNCRPLVIHSDYQLRFEWALL